MEKHITIKNEDEYRAFKAKVNAADSAKIQVSNAERSAVHEWEFRMLKPRQCFCYVNGNPPYQIATWTGQPLGKITSYSTPIKDNMGGTRIHLRATGSNGIQYWGYHYCGNSDYVRLWAYKEKSPTK